MLGGGGLCSKCELYIHHIVGDCSFAIYIVLLVQVSNGRRVVMVTHGSM